MPDGAMPAASLMEAGLPVVLLTVYCSVMLLPACMVWPAAGPKFVIETAGGGGATMVVPVGVGTVTVRVGVAPTTVAALLSVRLPISWLKLPDHRPNWT